MVINLLHALYSSDIVLGVLDYHIADYIVLIINTFMCLSCPLNLIVYCSMSKIFRKTFKRVISRLFCLVEPSLFQVPPVATQTTGETQL